MKLADIGLSTRITLWALLFVVAGGLLWVHEDIARDQKAYMEERSADLEIDLQLEKDRLTHSIDALRQDVLFLASVPPVSGIVRASANGGIDPRDKNSKAVWEAQLQEVFAAFLRAHPEYFEASYIAAAGDGHELVRVDDNDGRVEVVPPDALQAKGDQDYFKAGLVLTAGRVHLSEFELNQEHGAIEEPHRPTLRAVTTVFDANGNVFGMVVIGEEVRSLFASAGVGMPRDMRSYVTDQYGRYLYHPDSKRTFNFEPDSKSSIAADFPMLKPMFTLQAGQNERSRIMDDGQGGYLAAERVFFDASDPARFLLLVAHVPAFAAGNGFNLSSVPNWFYTLLLVLLVSGVFMLILRHTFAPLQRITAAAREIASGNREIRLAETGKGEIGELAQTLNVMLDKLSGHDLMEKENAFLKELIEALPGVFYMIDAQGRFRMWNRSLEQVLQRSTAEMAASHPLDFFAGDDKTRIEAAIRKVFETGETSIEAELISQDGTATPYHFTGRRVMRDGDEPVLIGLGLDISEQRASARATNELLRRNQALMQNSMEGIHILDIDGNVLDVNDAFCNMLGYTREEAIRLNLADWNAQYSREELRPMLDALINNSSMVDTVHRRKDGSLVDVEVCANGTVIDGKAYIFASCRDITERKKAQAALQRHKRVIETAMDGFWMVDANGFLEEVNEAYAKMSGYTMQELVGMHISELDADEHAEDVRARMEKIMALGYARFETRHRRKDGRVVDIEISTTYMPESGKFFVFSHNITQRKQAEQDLRVAAATFETHEAILITDAHANIIRVNRAFTEITGYTAEEVVGKNPRIMSSGRQDKEFYANMWKQVLENGSWAGEIWDRRKDGEIYPKWMNITAVKNDQGETTQYVSIFSDITDRKKAEEEIRNLAFYDALTRLPNRRLFLERFHTALAASARYGDYGAVLFLDLDRFKQLNDTLGHDYGDLLLIEVAIRIKACVREIDTVARFGGDEFVVLLESISADREEATLKAGVVAEKIREALAVPYQLREHVYESSPSIGVSLYHGNDQSMDELLKYADAAMYRAKGGGRNLVRFYDPDLQHDWESATDLSRIRLD